MAFEDKAGRQVRADDGPARIAILGVMAFCNPDGIYGPAKRMSLNNPDDVDKAVAEAIEAHK